MKDEEFKYLIRRSEKTEKEILDWYRQSVDKKAHLCNPPVKEYDIYSEKAGNIEIKEDLLATETGYYALEYEDARGNPSGVSVTTATDFVIVDKEAVLFTNTVTLLFLIKDCLEKRTIRMGYTTRDGKRALGYLVPRTYLLNSPYIKVVKRWWPWR